MSDITYADVARFYADKDDTDEIATKPYLDVAKAVWDARDKGDYSVSEYAIIINKRFEDNKRSQIDFDVITDEYKREEDSRFKKMAPLSDKVFYIHEKADDYVFAWLIASKSKKPDGGMWNTPDFFITPKNKYNDFYPWFVYRCNPIMKKYKPGQKWHLYEFIIYREMNYYYHFSKVMERDSTDKFDFGDVRYSPLVDWMTNQAGVNTKDLIEKEIKQYNA